MYVGSVSFFKHLIVSTILLLIIVPTVTCFSLLGQKSELKEENGRLQSELEQMKADYKAAQESLSELEEALSKVDNIPLYGYQKLYPEMYFERKYGAFRTFDKTVFLTFDDGPSPRTDEILEILSKHGVRATFFVVSNDQSVIDESLKQDPSFDTKKMLRRILREGHSLGLHSYTHKYDSIYASPEAYLADFNKMYHFIHDATGVYPGIFRFPGGSLNSHNGPVYQRLMAEMDRRGFVFYDWNLSAEDARAAKTKEDVVKNVLTDASKFNQPIVLMHDSVNMTQTVEALEEIIVGFKERGYTFKNLSTQVMPKTLSGYKYK